MASHVYVLAHPVHPWFKLGKANDVLARAASVGLSEVSLKDSFALAVADTATAFRVERALHRLLHRFRIHQREISTAIGVSSGVTEWFSNLGLPPLVQLIPGIIGLADATLLSGEAVFFESVGKESRRRERAWAALSASPPGAFTARENKGNEAGAPLTSRKWWAQEEVLYLPTGPRRPIALESAPMHGLMRASNLFVPINKVLPRKWYGTSAPLVDAVTGRAFGAPTEPLESSKTISNIGGPVARYIGQELRMDDFVVALGLIRRAVLWDELDAEWFSFKPYSLLTELGWSDNAESVRRLAQCVERLTSHRLEIGTETLLDGCRGTSLLAGCDLKLANASLPWRVSFGLLPFVLPPEVLDLTSDWGVTHSLTPAACWLLNFVGDQGPVAWHFPLSRIFTVMETSANKHEARRNVRESLDIIQRLELKPAAGVAITSRNGVPHLERTVGAVASKSCRTEGAVRKTVAAS